MKNIRVAILALCAATFGCVTTLAQIDNTSYGSSALSSNAGFFNSAFGAFSLTSPTASAEGDSAFGTFALQNTTSGYYDSAFGSFALYINSTGSFNSAFGEGALENNTSGQSNAAVGSYALWSNTTGNWNTSIGQGALAYNTTGVENIGIGYYSGSNLGTGSFNIDIGNNGLSGESNTIRIGDAQTSFFAAGVNGIGISGGVPVFINSNGQLGTVNSSIRFKEDVHDMGDASSRIFLLRPVTYRYNQPYADGSKPIDYGLIAEEVAKVYPDMVVKGADGQIQTVQYQKLTPMLLNEVQKQHQVLEQQQQTITDQGEAMRRQEISIAEQGQTIRKLEEQQTATIQMLEKRLAALEAAQTANDPALRSSAE